MCKIFHPSELVKVSKSCVRVARLFGFDPKVAFLSPLHLVSLYQKITKHVRDAIELLKKRIFWFWWWNATWCALNPIYQEIYPFSKIVGNANILIMPALLVQLINKINESFGEETHRPTSDWPGSPIEVAPLRASTSEILNLASIAAYSSDVIDYDN